MCPQVMQKSCRCGFMYGELTDKETIARIEECLEGQIHDQFEILLYKKTSKSPHVDVYIRMQRLKCEVREALSRESTVSLNGLACNLPGKRSEHENDTFGNYRGSKEIRKFLRI